MKIVANLSLMFGEYRMLDRFDAARRCGFSHVEIQFPYEYEIDDLIKARDAAGVTVVLINLPAGDMQRGEAGLTALPGREVDYRKAVDLGYEYAQALGARLINSLAGKPADAPADLVAGTARANLTHAAARFSELDATVLVEPVNPTDVPGYYLVRLKPALDLVEAVNRDNVRLLFDFYHMQQTEPSLGNAIRRCASLIGHVQFADTPGRHEPGTGEIDFAAALGTLKDTGYAGFLSAEYRATGRTEDSLKWLPEFGRIMAQGLV